MYKKFLEEIKDDINSILGIKKINNKIGSEHKYHRCK